MAALLSSPPLPASWNELYLMLGTSSAALIGLLFVATSLHLAEIANEEIYRLRAQYTTLILLSTLMQSTAVLMPQSMKILGFELLVINLLGLSFPVTLLSKAGQDPGRTWSRRLLSPSCDGFHCRIVIGIIGAGAVATGREWGMYGVTVSYALLLFISIWNGWMIMQGIGRGERFRKMK